MFSWLFGSPTALHLACSSGQLKVVKLLLKSGGKVAAVDSKKRTPLHSACMQSGDDSQEIVRLLLDAGADIEAKNKDGWTPLHFACKKSNLETAQLLIQHGAQLDAMDHHKRTPLHLAVRKGSFEMVQLLLDKGANLEATNYAGCTPLHEACRGGCLEVVILLIDMGADVMSKCANGSTALELSSGFPMRMAVLNAQNAANGSFILPDAVLSPQDEERYPLHCAIKHGYEEDITEAIAEIDGESKNMKDSQGRTAIDLAALTGQWEMVKYLKEKGCVHSFKPKFAMQSICRQRNDRLEDYLKQIRGSGQDADGEKVDGVKV